jgi:hypothetical protein
LPDWLELADSLCLPELEGGDGIDGLGEGIGGIELLLDELDGGLLLGIEGADGGVCCGGVWHA